MTKNPQTRVDDVRDDIVALTPGPQQNAMRAWINNYWTNNVTALKTLSNTMTMTNVANAGNTQERANRRVLTFLEALKFGSDLNMGKNRVSAVPGASLAALITPLINKLAIQADQQFGNGLLIQQEFTLLQTQPLIFLQNKRLNSGSIGANQQNFFFYDYDRDQYKIDMARPAHYPHAHQFNAVTVPGVFWLNVPGRTNNPANGSFATIDGTKLDTNVSTVMISTMFSGCSFCFKQENASQDIYAAHIMPDDGAGNVVSGAGTGLARQLGGQVGTVAAGDFTGTGAGNFHVYGAGWSDLHAPLNVGYPVRTVLDQFMNIFGTHIHGAWQIWSQHINNNQKTVVQVF
jgi:hypothetical protein